MKTRLRPLYRIAIALGSFAGLLYSAGASANWR